MSETFTQQYNDCCAGILDELSRTLASIDTESLERLSQEILKADQVFFIGVGRVLLSLQSVCKGLTMWERLQSRILMKVIFLSSVPVQGNPSFR